MGGRERVRAPAPKKKKVQQKSSYGAKQRARQCPCGKGMHEHADEHGMPSTCNSGWSFGKRVTKTKTAAATKEKVSAARGKVSAAKAAAPKAAKGKVAAKAVAPKATKGKAAATAAAPPVKKAIAKKRSDVKKRSSGRMTAANSMGAMSILMNRNFDAVSMSMLRAMS